MHMSRHMSIRMSIRISAMYTNACSSVTVPRQRRVSQTRAKDGAVAPNREAAHELSVGGAIDASVYLQSGFDGTNDRMFD